MKREIAIVEDFERSQEDGRPFYFIVTNEDEDGRMFLSNYERGGNRNYYYVVENVTTEDEGTYKLYKKNAELILQDYSNSKLDETDMSCILRGMSLMVK